jgi:hypothetical protein
MCPCLVDPIFILCFIHVYFVLKIKKQTKPQLFKLHILCWDIMGD